MKSMCLWMLLLLLAAAPVFSQSGPATNTESPVVIESVECRGNATIPCEFIRSKLHLPANVTADGDAVQSAQLRLSALPNFESVRVYLEKGSEKGRAFLIVEVVEASPIATEWVFGLQHYSLEQSDAMNGAPQEPDRLAETLTGRMGNLNLFGRQKIGELAVKAYHIGYGSADASNLNVSLNYIDPSLFGMDRIFMSVSGHYYFGMFETKWARDTYDPIINSIIRREVSVHSTSRIWRGSVSVGYRLWQYSYVFAGFDHYDESYNQETEIQPPYEKTAQEGTYNHSLWRVGYGWDSEDDAYFPTRGSRLSAIARYYSLPNNGAHCDCHEIDWRIAYKQSWMLGRNSVWTLNIGGEPEVANDRLRPGVTAIDTGLGITYSHLLSASDALGGIRRGRWYVQVGAGPLDLSRDGHIGGQPTSASIALGLRFESKVLGIVNLSAAGLRSFPRGGL